MNNKKNKQTPITVDLSVLIDASIKRAINDKMSCTFKALRGCGNKVGGDS